jgi:hypothetical protein
MDVDLFIGDDEERRSAKRTARERQAKEVCRKCPVSAKCLDEALDMEEVGIWGGTNTQERKRILRVLVRDVCVRCRSRLIDTTPDGKGQVCLSCAVTWRIVS